MTAKLTTLQPAIDPEIVVFSAEFEAVRIACGLPPADDVHFKTVFVDGTA